MDQTASQLRQELDRKRTELTRDVDRIEEKVKSSFDVHRKIDEQPLLAVGLSVAGGFLLGNMVGGGKKQRASAAGSSSYPSSAFYSGASTAGPYWSGPSSHGAGGQWSQSGQQPSQGNGPGIVGELKAGLKESFRRGSGTNVDDALTNITAALTAVLMDKAKELLDRNLPGFATRYEQVAHTRDASMSGAGAGRQGFSSGYASGAAGAPTPYSTAGGQTTPYSSGEPAFSPADATTIGGSSTMDASRSSTAGGSSSATTADYRDSASRDAGMRDPS